MKLMALAAGNIDGCQICVLLMTQAGSHLYFPMLSGWCGLQHDHTPGQDADDAAKALAPMPVSFSITCPDHITEQVAHDQLRLVGENTMVPAQKAC